MRVSIFSLVRLLSLLVFCATASLAPADAKSDCIKALNEAKKAGLPLSIADLGPLPAEKGSKEFSAAMAEANKIGFRREKRRMIILPDYKDTRVLKRVKSFSDVMQSDKEIQACDRDLLALANKLIQRGWKPSYEPLTTKIKQPESALRSMIRVKMDDASRAAASGNLLEVIKNLQETRKLPALTLNNALYMSVFMETSLEKSYYQYLLRLVDKYPNIGRQLPYSVVAPLAKPNVRTILREEFLSEIASSNRYWKSESSLPGFPMVKLPNDQNVQEIFRKTVGNFTVVYQKCGNAKSYSEASGLYWSIKKDLGTVPSDLEMKGGKLIVGPNWMDLTGTFDRMLIDRETIIKKMGIKRP